MTILTTKSDRKIQNILFPGGMVFLISFCCLMLFAGCGNLPQGRFGQEAIKVAVLPSYSTTVMSKKFIPLLERMSRETGYDVQYISAEGISGFGAAIENSGAQMAICDALTYLTLKKTRDAVLLAVGCGTDGSLQTAGLVVAPLNGPAELSQLRGRTVCCASRRLADGFLSPAMSLLEAGIDPGRDIKVLVVGQLDRVIPALDRGSGQAGFIPRQLWNDSLAGSYRVLAEGRPVSHWLLVSLQGGHSEADEKIKEAVLGLDSAKPDDSKLLSSLGLSRFEDGRNIDLSRFPALADSLGLPY